jgi:hypothetical protein
MVLRWLRGRQPANPEVIAWRARVATELESVAVGSVTASEALRALDDDPNLIKLRDRLADDAWHDLVHFRDDQDIHARDVEYFAADRRGLRRWASRLRGEG